MENLWGECLLKAFLPLCLQRVSSKSVWSKFSIISVPLTMVTFQLQELAYFFKTGSHALALWPYPCLPPAGVTSGHAAPTECFPEQGIGLYERGFLRYVDVCAILWHILRTAWPPKYIHTYKTSWYLNQTFTFKNNSYNNQVYKPS